MRKNISLLLAVCLCFCLTACGVSAASNAPAAPAAEAVPAQLSAESNEPAPEASAAPTVVPDDGISADDLKALVETLNEEEVAQRTEDDPAIGVFEVGTEKNTIVYKFAMHIFQYVIMMAEAGDAENLNAYNRLLDALPPLEDSLENALRESMPALNIQVILMSDEYSDEVAAVVEDGEIVYDLVNGVGTAPKGITPILEMEELPPEIQAQLDQFKESLASD